MQLSSVELQRLAGVDPTPAYVRDLVERLMRRFQADIGTPTRRTESTDQPPHPDAATAPPQEDRAFRRWLGQASGMRLSLIAQLPVEAADFGIVPKAQGRRRLCVALRRPDDTIDIVLADPFDRVTRLWLESRLRDAGHPGTRWYVATADDLLAFYARLDQQTRALPARPARQAWSPPAISAELVASLHATQAVSDDDGLVAQQLNQILLLALQARASDIHLACVAGGLQLRLRIDGVLQATALPHGLDSGARGTRLQLAQLLLGRLKHLAGLPATPARQPVSGTLRLAHDGRELDLRLSLLPNPWGEDAVLQLLDRRELQAEPMLSLGPLGLDDAAASFLRQMAARPHGLLLVTGPASSGKTTTLYGLLSELASSGHEKIITLEDPVEHLLPQVLQLPLGPEQSHVEGLATILQHDPDRVMLGDLPEADTLHLAVRAALGGLPVHAALQAKDVFDAIGQLGALGLAPELLAGALNGVLAQRLVRRLCPHCAEPVRPEALGRRGRELPAEARHWQLLQARGCSHCHGSGYQGRRLLTQTLTLDATWREQIAAGASTTELRALARRRGLPSLRRAALALLRDGITSLDEVERVTAVDE
jgi:general secretion pathway protein E